MLIGISSASSADNINVVETQSLDGNDSSDLKLKPSIPLAHANWPNTVGHTICPAAFFFAPSCAECLFVAAISWPCHGNYTETTRDKIVNEGDCRVGFSFSLQISKPKISSRSKVLELSTILPNKGAVAHVCPPIYISAPSCAEHPVVFFLTSNVKLNPKFRCFEILLDEEDK